MKEKQVQSGHWFSGRKQLCRDQFGVIKKGHKQGSPQHRAVYLPSCTVTILHYWAFIFTLKKCISQNKECRLTRIFAAKKKQPLTFLASILLSSYLLWQFSILLEPSSHHACCRKTQFSCHLVSNKLNHWKIATCPCQSLCPLYTAFTPV